VKLSVYLHITGRTTNNPETQADLDTLILSGGERASSAHIASGFTSPVRVLDEAPGVCPRDDEAMFTS